jgi:gas vesicle protein
MATVEDRMRFDNGNGDNSHFMMGLMAGALVGAALGLLFAPKPGAELRSELSDGADSLANQATKGYRKAANQASYWIDKTTEAVNRGTEEARRYVREASAEGGPGPRTSHSS